MKKQIISAISAIAMIADCVFGVIATNGISPDELLAPRAAIEIIDGEIKGITKPVDAHWLKEQFSGNIEILSASGESITDKALVPSDSTVVVNGETVATLTVSGDSNMDGNINLFDVSAILKYIAKWTVDISANAADANKDGDINLSDVSLLLKYIAKWDVNIFDSPAVLHVFTKGVTEYKLLSNDPSTDEKIVSAIKMLTGTEIEVITDAADGDRFITVGKDLYKTYGFIDEEAVKSLNGSDIYLDTYGKNIYLTANSDEGILGCVNFITYKAFTPELDVTFAKGAVKHIDDTDIAYTDVISDGKPNYDLVKPAFASVTLTEATELIKDKIKSEFYPLYGSLTDGEDDEAVMGEFESDYSEILVGMTDRIESKEVYLSLSQGEYSIRIVGDKLVILGFNDDLTYLAARHFAENILCAPDGKNVTVPSDLCIVRRPYDTVEKKKPAVEIEDITPSGDKIALQCERWIATEIEFTSDVDYTDPVYTMTMDAVFCNKDTGTAYTVPAFWDGGRSFKVRFALTETGSWEFYTKCSNTEDTGLHHRTGTVVCSEYSGELDIYRHGFVKTVPGKNYFVYDDGTPFFYLGDTHWSLPLEEIDSYGSVETQQSSGITADIAEKYGITSQLKYIMDHRVAQGYTVIQSQPLGWWTTKGGNSWFADEGGNIFTYGVNDTMLAKFREYDRHFAYIAEVGLVHANSQLSCVDTFINEYFAGSITDSEVEMLCRYWVARYSAYPVLWTTAQEADDDYYGLDRGYHDATPDNNPWYQVMDYVHKYDPYTHPSTAHQEHWFYTRSSDSTFDDREAHTWYAAQYHMFLHLEDPYTWQFLREYYGNHGSKPAINYEGRYDHFWVGTYGARAQGWQAFMNGNFGYGYGVQPIWALNWSFVEGLDDSSDELGSYNRDDNWVEGLYAEGGQQVSYMKTFIEKYEWWKLVPCFNRSYYYEPNGWGYSVSTIGNDVYLGYFYGTNEYYRGLGTLMSMKNGDYEVTWFNCRTGEYTEPFTVSITDEKYKIPRKPGDGDWAIAVEYKGK